MHRQASFPHRCPSFTKLQLVACALAVFCAAAVGLHATTIAVTTTTDSGPGSLRDALANATDGDTIDASVVTGTILLTSGELLVTNSVNIIGPGPDLLAVNGNRARRVFHIGSNTVVSVSGLTVTNGVPFTPNPPFGGGGILNDHATLILSNCTLSGNSSSGIRNDGSAGNASLVVIDCILSGNGANTGGGGIFNSAKNGTASVKILNSTLSDNSGGETGGGGICNNSQGGIASVEIVNSTLAGNLAANGGGICNGVFSLFPRGGTASVEIVNSTVISNSVYGNGGSTFNGGGGIFNDGRAIGATLTVIDSIVSSNSAMAHLGSGGGIVNFGTATLSNSTISGNSVGFIGGGIDNGGTMQIASTSVKGNTSYEVGGIFNTGNMQISDSTISSNSPGGIWNRGEMQIVNTTLSGNSTAYDGGAIASDGTMQIAHSTISGNSARIGGGISNVGSATLENTILDAGATGVNISGTIASLGYNLSSDDGGGFLTAPGDQINTDPMLGPLQDNGGPTPTHALLPGSPAINAGDPNFTPPPDFDQRGPGFPRVVCGRIDIGAFEASDTTPPVITCPSNIVVNAVSPKGVFVSFTPTASDDCSSASVSTTPPSGSRFTIGDTLVSCVATDAVGNQASCDFTVHVKGTAEQIDDLIALVQRLHLKPWTANSLLAKLQAASSALRRGNTRAACGNLDAFIFEVDVQTWWRQIWPAPRGRLLIRHAQRIRAVLDCHDGFNPGHP